MKDINRRSFIKIASAASATVGAVGCASTESPKFRSATLGAAEPPVTKDPGDRMLFGACSDLAGVPMMKELGFDFFEYAAAPTLIPTKSDEEWRRQRRKILNAALPIRSCNGFLPGTFRLTGPKADFAPALDYADILCRRADEVGLKYIVFGSGGARNVPSIFGPDQKDFRNDIQGGRDQFIEFTKRLADRIADRKVTIVIEPLCPNESNIINYVWQGMQVVRIVNSPRVRELADLYHMMQGWEKPDSIIEAGPDLKHCHIASKGDRNYPGSGDVESLKPLFHALKQIGYTGGISCECGWRDPAGKLTKREMMAKALATMRELEATA